MKIYKYTSLNSAISILKSGGVALSNPKDFNDPNDCSFVQNKKDKEKIEKLIADYSVYKVINELVSLNKITLNKYNRTILTGLQKEIDAMKWILEKNPYFNRIPGFNLISKMVGTKTKEFDTLVAKAKKELQDKIDEAVKNAKESALISCFSKRNNSILMWAHYANSHKGVCIEYERPGSIDFKNVKYKKRRPFIKMYKAVSHVIALDILQKKETDDEIASYLKETLNPFFIKSTDWLYENEVRCLYSRAKLPDNISYDGKRYILNIGYPKAIYIGCKAAGDELDHLYNLAKNRGIPVYFVKKSEDTFDVVIDKNYKYKLKSRRKPQEITILRLINDIDNCLNSKLYLAAFSSSLIIPDICSQVECPNIQNIKERYIKWCDIYLPCANRGPDSDGIAYITGEILWNIKEKLFSEGNVDVYGNYEDFCLKKIVLRIEERKAWDIYIDVLSEGDVTINVTKFCVDMIYQAQRCYKEHETEIKALSQLPIEDYDAKLESMHECGILTERINKLIKGKK